MLDSPDFQEPENHGATELITLSLLNQATTCGYSSDI